MPIINRGGGGGPSGPSWVQKYEADFTDAGTYDWCASVAAGQGFHTVNGVGWGGWWNGVNNTLQTGMTALEINPDARGLRVDPAPNQTHRMDGNQQQAGRLMARTDLLLPTQTDASTLCFQAYGAGNGGLISTTGSEVRGYGLCLTGAVGYSNPFKYHFAASYTFLQNGARQGRLGKGTGLTYWPGVAPWNAFDYDFFEIIVHPYYAGVTISIGQWGGSWPEPGTQTAKREAVLNSAHNGGPCGPSDYGGAPANNSYRPILNRLLVPGDQGLPYVGLFGLTNGNGTQLEANFYKFRALMLE